MINYLRYSVTVQTLNFDSFNICKKKRTFYFIVPTYVITDATYLRFQIDARDCIAELSKSCDPAEYWGIKRAHHIRTTAEVRQQA